MTMDFGGVDTIGRLRRPRRDRSVRAGQAPPFGAGAPDGEVRYVCSPER